MRVLIVEDEPHMAELIGRGLAKEGMAVDIASTGEQAVEMAGAADYDSIVLDVLLPGIDGFETCRRLRSAEVWSPVVMLTALDSVEDRVLGLDTGADDYLVKPFAFAELLARLRAVARRREPERPSVLVVDDLRLDPASRRVWRGSVEISLSAKEFAILETFMRRPDEALDARAPRGPLLGQLLLRQLEHHRRLRAPVAAQDRRAVRAPDDRDGARLGLSPAPGRRGVSRIPIRLRVAAAFAVAMAVVLVATGWYVYSNLATHLSTALNRELRLRAQDLSTVVGDPDSSLPPTTETGGFVEKGENYAQLVTPDGVVVQHTNPLGAAPLLTKDQLRRALDHDASSENARACRASTSPRGSSRRR